MSSVLDGNYALITQPNRRSFGTIVPDIVLQEVGTDNVQKTQHPVEQGAAVVDHAFVVPAKLLMRCGFSNSTAGYVGYVQEMYAQILALKNALEPVNVVTGKRLYSNMLIVGLTQVTDQESENALMIVVSFEELPTASTQTTSGSPVSTSDNPADPSQTGDEANSNVTPTQTPNAAGIPGADGTQSGAAPQVGGLAPNTPIVPNNTVGFAGVPGLPGSPSGPAVTP